MNKKTKHFVTFCYPGAFVAENRTIEIDYRDPRKMLDLKRSEGAYGFVFHSIGYIEHDGKEFKSEIFDETGMFFIDGGLFTPEQIKKEHPDSKILLANMKSNKWKKVVKTNVGWFLSFDENDQIINR